MLRAANQNNRGPEAAWSAEEAMLFRRNAVHWCSFQDTRRNIFGYFAEQVSRPSTVGITGRGPPPTAPVSPHQSYFYQNKKHVRQAGPHVPDSWAQVLQMFAADVLAAIGHKDRERRTQPARSDLEVRTPK